MCFRFTDAVLVSLDLNATNNVFFTFTDQEVVGTNKYEQYSVRANEEVLRNLSGKCSRRKTIYDLRRCLEWTGGDSADNNC